MRSFLETSVFMAGDLNSEMDSRNRLVGKISGRVRGSVESQNRNVVENRFRSKPL